jgi:hypothetical protein
MAEKFWILWCPTSDRPPTVRLSTGEALFKYKQTDRRED